MTTEHRDFNSRASERIEQVHGDDPKKVEVMNAKSMSATRALEILRPEIKTAIKIIHSDLDAQDTYLPTDKDWDRGVGLASEIVFWTLMKIKQGEDADALLDATGYGWRVAVGDGRWAEIYMPGGAK